MCDRKRIGDEITTLWNGTYFSNERKILLPSRIHKNHNMLKFNKLMNSGNIETLKSLSRFIKKILNNVCSFLPLFHEIYPYFASPFL